ncbi:hypothetical protein PsorP6_001255 [Peronosclerospora sorghi]|uniref:Uncharacterized protein n=1 Tax=Peronosclerospora sorghi TaxID=230839 RepID=A0ACC0WU03_9STRA|nr:hypothetical protein PsorP6_001255 [Peronosclerospora sorghi]
MCSIAYVNPLSYVAQEFDFGVVKQTLHCSHAASTDHDLTSQVVRPVSAFLVWYLVSNRTELVGKTVVEWVLVRGSVGSLRRSSRVIYVSAVRLINLHFSAHTALTDGNEIVLKLLTKNVEINAELSKVQVLSLLWDDNQSVEHFERAFLHPVDVLLGVDVVCWPVLVKPILQTINYLYLRSTHEPNWNDPVTFSNAELTTSRLPAEVIAQKSSSL